MGARGYPHKARSSARSYDVATAQKLWRVSEELTGIHYDALNSNAGGQPRPGGMAAAVHPQTPA
jgi:hypothetical protein